MRQSLLRDASARAGAPGSPAYKVLLEQLTASCEELDVRKEEVLILRSQLVSQKEALQHKVEEPTSCCCSSCVRGAEPGGRCWRVGGQAGQLHTRCFLLALLVSKSQLHWVPAPLPV